MFKDPIDTGFFNHARLIEDLNNSVQVVRDARQKHKSIRAPLAPLHRLGKDLLNATPGDHGAWMLARNPDLTRKLAQEVYGSAFGQRLEFSWATAAAIIARDDLGRRFTPNGTFSWDVALQWFVLHGVTEHRLFSLLTPRFIKQLTGAIEEAQTPTLSPLQEMVLAERPDLGAHLNQIDFASFNKSFRDWLVERGQFDYCLFWCLDRATLEATRRRAAASRNTNRLPRNLRATAGVRHWLQRVNQFRSPDPQVRRAQEKADIGVIEERLGTIRRITPDSALPFEPLNVGDSWKTGAMIDGGALGADTLEGRPVYSNDFRLLLPIPDREHATLLIELLHVVEQAATLDMDARVNDRSAFTRTIASDKGCLVLVDLADAHRDLVPPAYHVRVAKRAQDLDKAASVNAWAVLSRLWIV